MTELNLGFDISFKDLYANEGLKTLDKTYLAFLEKTDSNLLDKLLFLRDKDLERKDYANFIVEFAPIFEKFLIELFDIQNEINYFSQDKELFEKLYKCKKLFVQRKVLLHFKAEGLEGFNAQDAYGQISKLLDNDFSEVAFATKTAELLLSNNSEELDLFSKYTAWACLTEEGRKHHKDWIIFQNPRKFGDEHKIELEESTSKGIKMLHEKTLNFISRDGFSLTSENYGLKETLDQANYCIHCHKTGKDSCSKGMMERTTNEDPQIKRNIYGEELSGCPLNEKISEMHLLKTFGLHIASLATAIIDNPMLAATGYRICNECMKSCIYQKQDPVNIPKAETGILRDILNLPWGFEIYRLLTQWNPLKLKDYITKSDTGKKILVVGMGPAGFTLAHYLLTEGHSVVAIDGLKIEPVDAIISGIDFSGNRVAFNPIRDIEEITEDLDDRVSYGFGGVAEYGITVRWDKNFLKIIRLILERNQNFRLYGGIRFGSNVDYNIAHNLGFDHIALSIGAGKPNLLNIPNALALGVRTASDFLMGLQLTGAAKKSSLANLQLRLPVVVVGGGLTAIDTATEAIAYYVREVEKFYDRYSRLCEVFDPKEIEASWNWYDCEVAAEFLAHAKMIIAERKLAELENRDPNFIKIVRDLGGVKILYRKRLQDAPSYKLNKEEVEFAFKEGIEFVENASILGVNIDKHDALCSLKCEIEGKEIELSAKTLLIATGTNPNTMLSREDKDNFKLDGRYFKLINNNVFISEDKEKGLGVTVFGDLHPKYKGNVVKAMASAKNHYKSISNSLATKITKPENSSAFFNRLDDLFLAKVHEINILTPNIIEIILKAPSAAKEFKPGQFYKLQNYEVLAPTTKKGGLKTVMAMEGIALTGAWVDKEKGLISTIVLEMGGSSNLCRLLKKDEPVVLMGPTGEQTHIVGNETVLLAGGGLGNAVLFSIGKAFREAGSRVLYFAGYKKEQDRYKTEEIEVAADQVVWCCDETELSKNRAQDISVQSNIVEAILSYSEGKLGGEKFNISDVDRIISIGSSGMMEAINAARKSKLQNILKPGHCSIASINSPMQCMMKEICAQCLQRHVDPVTGLETYVYTCANQDQNTDNVDFKHLSSRLKQNSLLEKLTAKWLEYIA